MLRNSTNYAHFLKGVSQYRNQKYDQAAQYFISSMTQQLDSNHQFGLRKQKKTQMCEQIKLRKLEINDQDKNIKQKVFCGSLQALLNLSCCLIRQKIYNKAEKLCFRAMQFNAYSSLAYYNLATINIRKEKYLEALSQIKCALSCEYLRKYERVYNKKDLDLAIGFAPNNLLAIKYRIGFNANLLRFLNSLQSESIQSETQVSIYEDKQSYCKEEDQRKSIFEELKEDIDSINKYNRIYEIELNQKNSDKQKQNRRNNFYISRVKPQFILQSDNNAVNIQKLTVNKQNKKLQTKLQLLKELKSLRQQYLKLLQQNQKQLNLFNILNSKLSQKQYSVIKQQKIKVQQLYHDKNKQQLSDEHEDTVETSFQLQDLYQNSSQDQMHYCQHIKQQIFSKSKLSKSKKYHNKQNLTYYNPNSKNNTLKIKNQPQNHPLTNCNKRINRKVLNENQYLASSVISIQDYSQSQISLHQNQQTNQQQPHQYTVNLIQSIIVPSSNHNQSVELFQIQQNSKSYDHSLMRNPSCQSLVNNLLSPDKDLKKSQYQFNSRLSQSKSHLKLLSCSKCSADHCTDIHRQKNVSLQINLAQIYNYQCNFSQLLTFCVIKHDGQQLKTQTSKGKFPNWKQPLQFNVDFTSLNQDQIHYYRLDQQINQSKKVKIQLWAKPTHLKKDPYLNPNDLLQLIGQQQIDLRQQKWTKKKIIIEKKLPNSQQKKKIAYMYVCLQKIKHKKL